MSAILISGPKGSGKTSAATYFHTNLGGTLCAARDLVESRVVSLGQTISHQTKLEATEVMRREATSRSIFELASLSSTRIIIDSVISNADLNYCRSRFSPSFHIFITADKEIRLDRIYRRARPDDLDVDIEKLAYVESRDDVHSLRDAADVVIFNDQSIECLYAQLHDCVEEYIEEWWLDG